MSESGNTFDFLFKVLHIRFKHGFNSVNSAYAAWVHFKVKNFQWNRLSSTCYSQPGVRLFKSREAYRTCLKNLKSLVRISMQILLVGDSGVGKSSLLLRFTTDEFDESTSPTIGELIMPWRPSFKKLFFFGYMTKLDFVLMRQVCLVLLPLVRHPSCSSALWKCCMSDQIWLVPCRPSCMTKLLKVHVLKTVFVIACAAIVLQRIG